MSLEINRFTGPERSFYLRFAVYRLASGFVSEFATSAPYNSRRTMNRRYSEGFMSTRAQYRPKSRYVRSSTLQQSGSVSSPCSGAAICAKKVAPSQRGQVAQPAGLGAAARCWSLRALALCVVRPQLGKRAHARIGCRSRAKLAKGCVGNAGRGGDISHRVCGLGLEQG